MPSVAEPSQSLNSIAVVIPAWKPDSALLQLLLALQDYGFGPLILVDDGSGEASQSVLDQARSLPRVRVIRHARNLGKGRALKTGFNHCLVHLPQCSGVVTADADGQHTPADIARVAKALLASGGRTVLGSRRFTRKVPLRSKLGNRLTQVLFGLITGANLVDTQTGLRGFPRSFLAELMALDGERYEYEMCVLAHICRDGAKPVEIPIETVYLEGNRSSHFDPVRDSMRIYLVLTRSLLSSVLSLVSFSVPRTSALRRAKQQ